MKTKENQLILIALTCCQMFPCAGILARLNVANMVPAGIAFLPHSLCCTKIH